MILPVSAVSISDAAEREQEQLALMVKGIGNKEIAAQLMISLSMTKSHVSSILNKLGLASRTDCESIGTQSEFRGFSIK